MALWLLDSQLVILRHQIIFYDLQGHYLGLRKSLQYRSIYFRNLVLAYLEYPS